MGLKRICLKVRFLGSYPRADVRPEDVRPLRPGTSDEEFVAAVGLAGALPGRPGLTRSAAVSVHLPIVVIHRSYPQAGFSTWGQVDSEARHQSTNRPTGPDRVHSGRTSPFVTSFPLINPLERGNSHSKVV